MERASYNIGGLSRRDFLKSSLGFGAGLVLAPSLSSADKADYASIKVFDSGPYETIMAQIREEKLIPANMAHIVRKRVEAYNSNNNDEIDFWFNNHFNTADGGSTYKGKVKLHFDSPSLFAIEKDAKLEHEGLSISENELKSSDGQEFSLNDLKKYALGRLQTKPEAKDNLISKTLVMDNNLHSEYVDIVFAELKNKYNSDKGMSIILPMEEKTPVIRPWFVDKISMASEYWCFGFSFDGCIAGLRAKDDKNSTLEEKL